MSTLKVSKLKQLATDHLGAFAGTREPLKIFKGEELKTGNSDFTMFCGIVSYCHVK